MQTELNQTLTQDEKVRMSVAKGEAISKETMRANLEQDIARLRVFVHDILSNPATLDTLSDMYYEKYEAYRQELAKQESNGN